MSTQSQQSPGAFVIVAAAAIIEGDRVLLTQRKSGSHLAGLWELPGGKLEANEDPRQAVQRELREELGIEVTVGAPLEVTSWQHPAKRVLLLFFEARMCNDSPAPRCLDVADFMWATVSDLAHLEFPPADEAVLRAIARRLTSGTH